MMENPRCETRPPKFVNETIELAVGNLQTGFPIRGRGTINNCHHHNINNNNNNNTINEFSNSTNTSCSSTRPRGTTTDSAINPNNRCSGRMDILEAQQFLPSHDSRYHFGPQEPPNKASPIGQVTWIRPRAGSEGGVQEKDIKEDEKKAKYGLGGKTWQIIPSVCASLFCVPFGIAFGWPSPTNPILLQENSTIPITLDQSAMIAGSLMIGNTVGSPFTGPGRMACKQAILGGVVLMAVGWVVMWHAFNIYCLLGSRILVGLGHSFALGYVKQYIREMTLDDRLAAQLNKALTLWMVLGVILAVSYGNYVSFQLFGLITVAVTIFVLFVCLFLPATPRDLVRRNRMTDAANLVKFLKRSTAVDREMADIYRQVHASKKGEAGLKLLIKNGEFRARFATFTLLVFFQQFTGLPATIIYSKITLLEAGYPEDSAIYLTIAYCLIFFFANIIGIYVIPEVKLLSKKYLLLTSSALVLCANSLLTCITYFANVNVKLYVFFPVFALFLVVHTLGLGNLPVTLINDYFPPNLRPFATNHFVMVHSMCGLVITKLFQTLLGIYGLYASFSLFSGISAACALFIVIFVPKSVKALSI